MYSLVTLGLVTNLLRLVNTIGATARLTRLVTDDVITRKPRGWVEQRLLFDPQQRARLASGEPPGQPRSPRSAELRTELAYLLHCRWCASVWTGSVVALAAARFHRTWWFQAGCAALTASYLTGWLAQHEEPAPVEITLPHEHTNGGE